MKHRGIQGLLLLCCVALHTGYETNLCINKFVKHKDKTIMLQATSIYTQGNGEKWNNKEMFDIMLEISKTSLKMLASDLFNQITKK